MIVGHVHARVYIIFEVNKLDYLWCVIVRWVLCL